MVKDFQEMLNNGVLTSPDYLLADIMSDDIMIPDQLLTATSQSYCTKAYQWAPTIWSPAEDDPIYNNAYQLILQMNIVLDNIDNAGGGTEIEKNIVRAQAKVNRAYYYLQLVNLYAPVYQASTANRDLAVPLILHPDASLRPIRATVQQIYNLVQQDLQDASNTTDLPNFGADVIHPGRASVFALQARMYLLMGDYNKALATAGSALAIRSTLQDYNDFSFVNGKDLSNGVKGKSITLIDQNNNPELLFARVNSTNQFISIFHSSIFASSDLLALFDLNNDLRFIYNFTFGGNNLPTYFTDTFWTLNFDYSLSVPEMMLIKAECLARRGDSTEALTLLNLLRKARYKTGAPNVQLLPNADATDTDVLKLVFEERRRELFLHGGLRIFDLKRLNKDDRFKTDIKRNDQQGNVIATLPANSSRYLLPFAPKIIANNPLIIQNER